MAGCAKAGRKKKSPSNARYINERRQETNKRKRMARHAKRCTSVMPARGLARAIRRRPLQQAYAERMAQAA